MPTIPVRRPKPSRSASVRSVSFLFLPTCPQFPDAHPHKTVPFSFHIDSIVPEGGQVITTLPVSDANKTRRAEVDASFQLAYEVLDYEVSPFSPI